MHASPRYVDSNHGRNIDALPTRVLPPGTIKMLWIQMGQTHRISQLECHRVESVISWTLHVLELSEVPDVLACIPKMEKHHQVPKSKLTRSLRRLL